jgi:HPt (histidine-containing phosphotransfer) domain-containing protein
MNTTSPAAANDYNEAALTELIETYGEEGADELIDAFKLDLQEILRAVPNSLASGDAVSLRRQAHTIKGSCLMLKATQLAAECEVLEQSAMQQPIERLAAAATQMLERYARLLDALAQHRASSGGAGSG